MADVHGQNLRVIAGSLPRLRLLLPAIRRPSVRETHTVRLRTENRPAASGIEQALDLR